MTLIDRDATLEHMKSMAGCATCDNYNYVRCRSCSWNDAMNIVEETAEVDAVPVTWLKAHSRKCCETREERVTVENALSMWQQEQGAK